ncbi:hypothetical protein GF386_04910 [Candidatus Pacearchaeota archaeon]|nr:hypothetical protein [Candidatus Pacearchaeota archaeon]MBD3283453.1 hypothetical protein [Candidatus Pacearchaeota archaeon]
MSWSWFYWWYYKQAVLACRRNSKMFIALACIEKEFSKYLKGGLENGNGFRN